MAPEPVTAEHKSSVATATSYLLSVALLTEGPYLRDLSGEPNSFSPNANALLVDAIGLSAPAAAARAAVSPAQSTAAHTWHTSDRSGATWIQAPHPSSLAPDATGDPAVCAAPGFRIGKVRFAVDRLHA